MLAAVLFGRLGLWRIVEQAAQIAHMSCEGGAAAIGDGHPRARFPGHEILFIVTYSAVSSVAKWAPRLPSVTESTARNRVNSISSSAGSAFSVTMMRNRNDWWITSSGVSLNRSMVTPAQPEAAEHQRAPAHHRHAHLARVVWPHDRDGCEDKRQESDDRDKNHGPHAPVHTITQGNRHVADDGKRHDDQPGKAAFARLEIRKS